MARSAYTLGYVGCPRRDDGTVHMPFPPELASQSCFDCGEPDIGIDNITPSIRRSLRGIPGGSTTSAPGARSIGGIS